jgi:hypothetical protein
MWATLQVAFASHLLPQAKWCFDGTTYEIKEGVGGMVMISCRDRDNTPIRNTQNQATLGVYIKWMYMGSAAGEVAPLFLVFAVDCMPEGEFYIQEVVGLSSGNDITRSGFIAFAKSRAGNTGLWINFFLRFVIPTLQNSRNIFQAKVKS